MSLSQRTRKIFHLSQLILIKSGAYCRLILCDLYQFDSIEFMKAALYMLESHCSPLKTIEELLDTNSFSKQAPNCKRLIMPHLRMS